jgi:hypothetical protein
MTLLEAVDKLDSLNKASTIFAAEPWTANSQVIVATEPDSDGVPEEARKLGLKYFLEIFVAREFLEGWIANKKPEPTVHEKCARLIKYAITDA